MASAPALPASRPVLADVLPGARVRDTALVLTGVALMAGLAQVSIPVDPSPVPITGQTLGVGIIGATLGLRRGTLTMVLYLLAGLLFPIYSQGAHGWEVVYSARGGYLVGFVAAAALVGWLAERADSRKMLNVFLAFVIAQAVVFAFGLVGLKLATDETWAWTLHNGFVVFLFGGLVKAVIGALVLPGAWRAVRGIDRTAS